MTNKIIDYDNWKVRAPKNLDVGEYWSKEAQVHTTLDKLKLEEEVEFQFRNIGTLRKVVNLTSLYLENDANPQSNERNKRYLQHINEDELSYFVKRTR